MKLTMLIISVVACLLFVTSVYGFGGGKGYVSGTFWAADLDRNEQLSRNEAKAVYNLAEEQIFIHYDKNNNGSINFIEFAEFMQQSPWTDE